MSVSSLVDGKVGEAGVKGFYLRGVRLWRACTAARTQRMRGFKGRPDALSCGCEVMERSNLVCERSVAAQIMCCGVLRA